ncbi:uncharacterized protein LOC113209873 [Frankliniella occidentalis]|uniref:Uncharacterized protein LOC113209873 n=1 Tax=Frankliniella occidentalis TaxID=133901 RepID=A0A9C6XD33_FRAOC|nr:uncharacterized protein LOC113209873 [Frankliniella occidentalis]
MAMQHSNSRGFVANTMTAAGVLWEGNPVPHTDPGRTTLYVFLWTLFCLHFNPAYRAALAMANVHALEEPGPTELDDVKRVLLVSAESKPLMKEYPKLDKLLALVEICNGPLNCSSEFMRDMTDSALIMTAWTYWCFKHIILVDEDGKSLLKHHDEPLATYPISAMIARDSPIMAALNRITAVVLQSGLAKTWGVYHRRNLHRKFDIYRKENRRSNQPDPLGVHQILGPLSILAAGLLASLVVFLGEVRLGVRKEPPQEQRGDKLLDLRSLRFARGGGATPTPSPTEAAGDPR